MSVIYNYLVYFQNPKIFCHQLSHPSLYYYKGLFRLPIQEKKKQPKLFNCLILSLLFKPLQWAKSRPSGF